MRRSETLPILLAVLAMASMLSCLRRFGSAPFARAEGPLPAPAMHPPASLDPPPALASPKVARTEPEPERLLAESSLTYLPVEGFGDAAVALPLGSRRPRPVIVAVHGQNSRPEWMCWMAQHVVGSRAFVVCPRGTRTRASADHDPNARFTFLTSDAISREVDASLQALRHAYPRFVDPGPLLFFGHSYGAIRGVSVVMKDPARYPRVLLSEGGHAELDAFAAHQFGSHHGERVLFACGTVTCLQGAKLGAARFSGSAARAELAYAKGGGHYLYGPLADAIGGAFEWLVEGDPRYRPDR